MDEAARLGKLSGILCGVALALSVVLPILVLVALFTILEPTAQTLILGWNAPEKVLAIGLDGGTLGFLMASGLLTVIGWAMREAARVKAESEGFV